MIILKFYNKKVEEIEYQYGSNLNLNENLSDHTYLNNQALFSKNNEILDNYFSAINFFTKTLNEKHNVEKSSKFWEYLLGPWILDFLMILYERIFFIKNNIKINYNDYKIENENISNIQINYNYSELFFKIQDNNFNILIFKFIMKNYFGLIKNNDNNYILKVIPKEINKKLNSKKIIKSNKIKFIQKIKNKLINFIEGNFFNLKNNSSLLLLPELSFRDIFKIWFYSFFNINLIRSLRYADDKHKTKKIFSLRFKNQNIFYDNSFENINNILFMFTPNEYLENFEYFYNNVNKNINRKIIKLFIRSPTETSSQIRFMSAIYKSNGAKIISAQHGGQYSNYFEHPLELIERRLSDIYFTWGHNSVNLNSKYSNVNHSELIGCTNLNWIKRKKKYRKNGKIVIIGSPVRKYYSGAFSYSNNYSHQNISSIIDLLKKLNKKLSNNIIYRSGWNFGLNQNQVIRNQLKNIHFSTREDESHSFDLIFRNKLAIINYNSTTWLQLSFVNFPFILFIDFDYDIITESNRLIFNDMIKYKLLFNSSQELAKHLSNIDNNILTWWNSYEVQKTIKKINYFFCSNLNYKKFGKHMRRHA